MLAAGVWIPVLAALNAQLGARIGAPVCRRGGGLCRGAGSGRCGVLVVTGSGRALAALPAQPPYLFLAGALIAFISCRSHGSRRALAWAMRCSACLLGQMAAAR